MIRNNRGITLVALVVTIIVLIILAGITIGTLTSDNGVVKEARTAKEKAEKAGVEEQIELAIIKAEQKYRNPTLDKVIEEIKNNGVISDASQVDKKTGAVTSDLGYVVEGKLEDYIKVQPGETASKTKKDNYVDSNGDKATIPAGFTVSATENIINKGLVVIAPDEAKSEFVWVPVANITTMAKKTSGTDSNGRENYQGKLYDFSGNGDATTSIEKTSYGQGTTSYREPSLVTGNNADTSASMESITGTTYDAKSDYYSTILGYSGAKDFGNDMQKDYNAMVESVDTYKGFYIGRYETSISGEKVASKRGVTPMSAGTSSGNMWYGMYKKQKEYASKNNITSISSSMIWGSQYDAMLNWALAGDDKGKVTAKTNGNHNGTGVVNTGATTNDKINNIFDLEGNLKE